MTIHPPRVAVFAVASSSSSSSREVEEREAEDEEGDVAGAVEEKEEDLPRYRRRRGRLRYLLDAQHAVWPRSLHHHPLCEHTQSRQAAEDGGRRGE